MSTALYVTFFRFLLVPVFPLLYLGYSSIGLSFPMSCYLLLFFFLVSESTDVLDGFLARRKNEVTSLGKILDPLADSLVKMTILFCFTQEVLELPLPLILLFLYREFFVAALRTVCALHGFPLAARKSGKWKTIFQGIAIFVIFLCMILYALEELSLPQLQWVSVILISLAALFSLGSAVDYFYAHRKQLRSMIQN